MSYDFIIDKPQGWNSNPEALAFPYFSTWPKSLKQHPQGKAVYGAQRGPLVPNSSSDSCGEKVEQRDGGCRLFSETAPIRLMLAPDHTGGENPRGIFPRQLSQRGTTRHGSLLIAEGNLALKREG